MNKPNKDKDKAFDVKDTGSCCQNKNVSWLRRA
jgi:hypothetical protein